MPYIGNTIRAADDYRLIDDISSSFNGSTTSFALQVAGSSPVPFPKSPQQVLISVNGVIQEPDPTGASGFNLVGTNIVFSSAPTNGHAFFGIIYATADYLNAGGNFPSGSLGAPSVTFIGDENTGLYRKSGGSVGFVSDATEIANFDSNGITISSGDLILGDNRKAKFGASDDLQIFHDGSNSFINEVGTGGLFIRAQNTFNVQKAGTSEFMIKATSDGSVELYHDDSKKIETTSSGVTVSGGVTSGSGGLVTTGNVESNADNSEFRCGANADFKISHSGSLNILRGDSPTVFRNAANNETLATFTPNGSVSIRYDNSTKLETTSSGVSVSGSIAVTGTVDGVDVAALSSSVSGKLSNVVDDTTPQLGGNLDCNNKVVTLNDSTGSDNNRFKIGNAGDLQIYHNGSSSFVSDEGTGSLKLTTNGTGVDIQKGSSETIARFIADGAVELYYDNSKKLETITTGVTVTGDLNITDDLVINSSNAQQILRDFTSSSDSDITGLLSGSSFGTLLEAAPNGHHVIALRGNDTSDSFAIVSGGGNFGTDSTYDTLVARFFSNGVINVPDSGSLKFGTGNDLTITHDGSNSFIAESGAGDLFITATGGAIKIQKNTGENMIKATVDDSTELYYDNSLKLNTHSGGVAVTGELDVTGNIDLNSDSHRIKLGAGDDFQFYHDGSNNYIFTNNGDIVMQTTGDDILLLAQDDFVVNVSGGVENAIIANNNGPVQLYYNNSQKVQTTATGLSLNNNILSWNEGGDISDANATNVDHIWHNDTSNAFYFISDGAVKSTTGSSRLACGAVVFGSNDPTAAVNRLDDYEEGTFIPVLKGVDGGGTLTGQTGAGSGGNYTKIGNKVHVSFYFANPTGSNPAGRLYFEMPFTAASGNSYNGMGGAVTYTRNINPGSGRMFAVNAIANTNRLYLTRVSVGGEGETQYQTISDDSNLSSMLFKATWTFVAA